MSDLRKPAPPPPLLAGTTFGMATLCLMGGVYAFFFADLRWTAGSLATAIALLALAVIVLVFYWAGESWARAAVMAGAGTELIALTAWDSYSAAMRACHLLSSGLAVFLLYWLNTAEVRAWFAGRRLAAEVKLLGALRENTFTRVERAEAWHFWFGDAGRLSVNVFWRILVDGHVAITSAGRHEPPEIPEPIDPALEATKLLADKAVRDVTIDPNNEDLRIAFDMGVELQVISDASGRVPWKYEKKLRVASCE